VLAAYAEVDITQKIKGSAEQPLRSSHSEDSLNKLLPQSTDDSSRENLVISPYGTLPRQRSNKSVLPIYAEVQKPQQDDNDKTHLASNSPKQARGMHVYAEVEQPAGKNINNDKSNSLMNSSKEVLKQQVLSQSTDSLRSDTPPPQIPPQTADSFKFDSPPPHVALQTTDSLKSDTPPPQVPPQTADSLRLDSSNNVPEEMPMITAYATVDAKDVLTTYKQEVTSGSKNEVSRTLSKEEIAAKTKSLGRLLKPKSKPAPPPPYSASVNHPIPRARTKRLSRTHSAEISSGDSDAEKIPKVESFEKKDRPKNEPLYESVDDLGLNVTRKSKSPPKVSISDSPKPMELLSKGRESILAGRPSINSTSSQNNDDSDNSTDWDSDDEEEEQEVQCCN